MNKKPVCVCYNLYVCCCCCVLPVLACIPCSVTKTSSDFFFKAVFFARK